MIEQPVRGCLRLKRLSQGYADTVDVRGRTVTQTVQVKRRHDLCDGSDGAAAGEGYGYSERQAGMQARWKDGRSKRNDRTAEQKEQTLEEAFSRSLDEVI